MAQRKCSDVVVARVGGAIVSFQALNITLARTKTAANAIAVACIQLLCFSFLEPATFQKRPLVHMSMELRTVPIETGQKRLSKQ